jgi:hypothetical protein
MHDSSSGVSSLDISLLWLKFDGTSGYIFLGAYKIFFENFSDLL